MLHSTLLPAAVCSSSWPNQSPSLSFPLCLFSLIPLPPSYLHSPPKLNPHLPHWLSLQSFFLFLEIWRAPCFPRLELLLQSHYQQFSQLYFSCPFSTFWPCSSGFPNVLASFAFKLMESSSFPTCFCFFLAFPSGFKLTKCVCFQRASFQHPWAVLLFQYFYLDFQVLLKSLLGFRFAQFLWDCSYYFFLPSFPNTDYNHTSSPS